MSPYLALLSARYRVLLQYRLAALAGVGTQVFWGLIKIMILEAFYRSSDAAPPMDLGMVVAYVWLGQAFLTLQPWNHDTELESLIRRGDVAYELVRPVDLFGLWYARTLALRTANASLRALPIFVFSAALHWTSLSAWALSAPPSASAAAAFALALLAALVLSAAITTLVHVSFLWTISGDGMSRLMPAVVMVFSGMIVPLPLFPDWAQPLLEALPFRGLVDTPYRLYSGHIPAQDCLGPIALTLLWTAVFVALGRLALARGTRRLVVQGG